MFDDMTNDLDYGNLSERLVKAVPALKERYEKELEWWKGEWAGPHNIYGAILNPYLTAKLESHSKEDQAELDRIFAFLEELASSEDVHIQEVLAYTVLEYLYGMPDLFERAGTYMRPLTQKIRDDVVEFWRRYRAWAESGGS